MVVVVVVAMIVVVVVMVRGTANGRVAGMLGRVATVLATTVIAVQAPARQRARLTAIGLAIELITIVTSVCICPASNLYIGNIIVITATANASVATQSLHL